VVNREIVIRGLPVVTSRITATVGRASKIGHKRDWKSSRMRLAAAFCPMLRPGNGVARRHEPDGFWHRTSNSAQSQPGFKMDGSQHREQGKWRY
jgi:hypothetical protein